MRFYLYDILKYMNIYLKSGYLNAEEIVNTKIPFTFITGARGIGKTYGFFKYFISNHIPFILMRRLQDEAELQHDPITSSLSPVCFDLSVPWHSEKVSKKIRKIVREDTGDELCIIIALSTFSGARGIDLTRYDYCIYDEFITEPHVRAIKMEGLALMNAYETINRNKELQGHDPVMMICLSNSLNIANDVFMQFDLVSIAESMLETDQEIYQDPENHMQLYILQHSPISAKKAKTALYTAGSEEYAKMAIENKFILNDFTYVKARSLKEYICIWAVGDLYVYQHKSRQEEYYITFTKGPTKKIYGSNYMDLQRCRRDKWRYWTMYLDGCIRFDSYKAVALFEKYFN